MKSLTTPRGLPVNVPEDDSEDVSPKFDLSQIEQAKAYYDENGYVVFKLLYEKNTLNLIRDLWATEVKNFKGHMYRQATAKAERHSINKNGWIMNPILNLQSVDPKQFPRFRDVATNKILSAEKLKTAFEALIGDTPKVVQSMYFEGNSATWEHQDSYYLDSENITHYHQNYWAIVRSVVNAAPSLLIVIEQISELILAEEYYKALKKTKQLIKTERELIDHATKKST